jgi:hypothetical protein
LASAAIVGTLTYDTPTGTALSTETIEVWATLSLAADSDAFFYDPDSGNPFGFDPAQIPTLSDQGVPFASYTYSFLWVSRTCSGNFNTGCDAGPYTIEQGSSAWFDIEKPFTLNASESRSFSLATITPVGGSAPAGTYTVYNMGLGISVNGLDAEGNTIEAEIVSFNTCNSGEESCAFTRTVSAVPVPAAAWLFGSGILGLAGISRKRTARG